MSTLYSKLLELTNASRVKLLSHCSNEFQAVTAAIRWFHESAADCGLFDRFIVCVYHLDVPPIVL
jgi:hypothetical protein